LRDNIIYIHQEKGTIEENESVENHVIGFKHVTKVATLALQPILEHTKVSVTWS
jgi:hypothetical protein